MRSALRYVAQPDENGLFPHTVLCRVNDEVLGTGNGITYKDAKLRGAMAAVKNQRLRLNELIVRLQGLNHLLTNN
jgi:hypothetical protein